ncbi:hypothetical protein PHLCEN_2v1557 [Hermanssonia centrifuga]|uniref:Globin-sensor domain-containing protein n=1 Tax=Hermanssonia centrifuga TaxID=98765 RepID=A0A2R6RZD3_9APHY|nr:hypothetical protein PHLCEN_2v1557 [Hermanssonia centrifuga]
MDAQFALDLNTTPAEKICPYSDRSVSSGSRTASLDATSKHSSPVPSLSSHDSFKNSQEPRCPVIFTQEVDPNLIKISLDDRIAYLTDFLNFTSHDADVIKRIAPLVNDIIPGLVDDLYAKLFEFDITKKVFMTRNQVFMKAWARRVLTADYSNGKTWAYMDKVGIMHTGVSPFK